MKHVRLGDFVSIQPKSSIKAGMGKETGRYRLFTSSPIQTRFVDQSVYEGPALVLGTGGGPSVHYVEGAFATSTDCLVLSAKDGLHLPFVYHYLLGCPHVLQAGFRGAGLQHISRHYILSITLPFPSLIEQRHIATILDKVDRLISNYRHQLTLLDALIQSRFHELFGDVVTNNKGWVITTLGDYIEFLTSGSRGWSTFFSNEGDYFITIKNVKNAHVSIADMQHVTPPCGAEADRTRVKGGDLLISITADLGRTGVVSKEIAEHGAYINQHLTCIRLKKDSLNPIYAAYYLESDAGKRQFSAKNQSAVKAGLNFNAIRSLRMAIPPLSLQEEFVTFVSKIDIMRAKISHELQQATLLRASLEQQWFGK